MAPWELLYIYRARLRARLVLVQELLAVLGLAVGVALLFASQVASTSLSGSIQQLTLGVVGRASLQLVARAPDGFDERLLSRVRRLPGVQRAEPVLEQRATVLGPLGQRSVDLIAGEPRYVHLGGSLLQGFTATQLASLHALALPAPVARAIGVDSLQTVTLEIGATRLTALMGAKLDAGNIGALVNSPDRDRAPRLRSGGDRPARPVDTHPRPHSPRAPARGARRARRARGRAARERGVGRLRLAAVRHGRRARRREHQPVLGDLRAGGLHVRVQRDPDDAAPAPRSDRGTALPRRDSRDDGAGAAVRRPRARGAGLAAWTGPRRGALDRGVPREPRLPLVCVSCRLAADRDLAVRRALGGRGAAGCGLRGADPAPGYPHRPL